MTEGLCDKKKKMFVQNKQTAMSYCIAQVTIFNILL